MRNKEIIPIFVQSGQDMPDTFHATRVSSRFMQAAKPHINLHIENLCQLSQQNPYQPVKRKPISTCAAPTYTNLHSENPYQPAQRNSISSETHINLHNETHLAQRPYQPAQRKLITCTAKTRINLHGENPFQPAHPCFRSPSTDLYCRFLHGQ